ncbi:hypothetical protein C1A50_5009 [Paenibacillus polymyxa]|nr:hypothetical protein C1A50_5009 [Paenibacillus polymyxa]
MIPAASTQGPACHNDLYTKARWCCCELISPFSNPFCIMLKGSNQV